ncbi:pseudouridine synthase [Corynebacterium hindlerae]|nr:pseudouridine synthase [Corynebacterium hindlerae]
MAKVPIPARDGISPLRVVLRSVVPSDRTYYAGASGDSGFAFGSVLEPGTVLPKPTPAWYHEEVQPEDPIPFQEIPVFQGCGLMVVDKPAFVPSTPNGRIVRETVQTRQRVATGNDDIVAVHRLDRLTCGLLALSTSAETRGFYQQQFAQRHAKKRYRAVVSGNLPLGTEWQTFELPMLKVKGERQVRVDTRGKKTVTRARLLQDSLVELEPLTGHTHQLRVLCSHLGAPIDGDDTYPIDNGLQLDNFSDTLKLCATHLELDLWGGVGLGVWTSPRLVESGFWASTE